MEEKVLNEILALAVRYPNDSELGKHVRVAIRKYKSQIDSKNQKGTSN